MMNNMNDEQLIVFWILTWKQVAYWSMVSR